MAHSLVSFACFALGLSSVFSTARCDEITAADLAPRLSEVPVVQPEACPTKNTTIEPGICAECKASPHTLALNVKAYDYDEKVSIIAQTRGQRINCNSKWLKTSDGCWLSQWDVVLGDNNSTTRFCREEAPDLKIKRRFATTKYKSECYSNAWRATDEQQRIKMFEQRTDLTLICKSAEFYKTTYNCYVEAQNLDDFTDGGDLPDCGPQPLLREPKMREPDSTDTSCPPEIDDNIANQTTTIVPPVARDVEAVETLSPTDRRPPRTAPTPTSGHYLVNTTIGEDRAPCLRCPEPECRAKKVYHFGATVTIQCYSGTYLLTTEFCYLNNTLVDYQVQTESYLFPACDDFTDNSDRLS